MADRFPEEQRTFETRVTFIRDIFSNLYDPSDIMASCVNYKLFKSYEAYVDEIHKNSWVLYGRDPIAVLHQIDADDRQMQQGVLYGSSAKRDD